MNDTVDTAGAPRAARWIAAAKRAGMWLWTYGPDLVGIAIALAMAVYVVSPVFADLSLWGGHDWDAGTTHRWFAIYSIKHWHQFPFWDPHACGGYDMWGYSETDTVLVSPFFPIYLFGDVRLGLRLEILGAVLVSVWGTWALAGRFTKSAAARAFVCVAFVVNGRWAMQAAVGHVWHLYYCWVPWTLYFYERAHGALGPRWAPGWWKFAAAAGVPVALMVYAGALYPLPHTATILLVYGAGLALVTRSLQPLAAGGVTGAVAFGLAAPKLLPLADEMSRAPRHVDSTESMDLGAFVQMLTSPEQGSARIPQWGWHEWGIYVGSAVSALLVLGFFARGPREKVLKVVALLLVLLGFGAFHPSAPWPLLHHLPIYKSLHVPSRWLYPAVLVAAIVTAAGFGHIVARRRLFGRAALEIVGLLAVAWMARDVARASQPPMARAFWMQFPATVPPSPDGFHQEQVVPESLHYVHRDWSIPHMPATMAGIGVIDCYGGPLSIFVKDPKTGKVPYLGALGRGQPGYTGEYVTASGVGKVILDSWSPNVIDVHVEGGQPGDLIIVNQNYNAGWRVNGEPTVNMGDRMAARIEGGGDQRYHFVFRPRRLPLGLAFAALTIGAVVALLVRERRARRAASKIS